MHECRNDTFGGFRVVAEKFRRAEFLAQGEPDGFRRSLSRAGPRRARFVALRFHSGIEPINVDINATRFQRILRQIKREAVCIVERESYVTWQNRRVD